MNKTETMNGSISESVFMILVRHFRGESNLYLHRCLHTIVHEGNGPHAPGQMAQLMWIYTLFNRCEHTYIIQPCIMGSHNFKGTASSVFGIHCWLQCNMYIAVQYVYCSAIYIYIYIHILHCNIQPQEGEELWRMTTSAQSWPHDGVWPTFQEKKRKG